MPLNDTLNHQIQSTTAETTSKASISATSNKENLLLSLPFPLLTIIYVAGRLFTTQICLVNLCITEKTLRSTCQHELRYRQCRGEQQAGAEASISQIGGEHLDMVD